MRVALLGAAGIIGKDIARRLAETGSWDILLADRREEDVRGLGKELGHEAIGVDVRDSAATARAVQGWDLVLNATWYYFNLDVMEACLVAGCDYMDLGGLYHTTRKQLALGPRFEKADLRAVLGCGKAPGITNVLAASAARHFEQIDSVRLRSGRRPLEETPGLRLPYSPQTLIDEMTLRPVVLERGRLREIEPLSRRERVCYPDPIGEIDYLATLHSELATLPDFLQRDVEEMDFQVALAPDTVQVLETLIRLGLTSTEPVMVEGKKVVPRDLTVALLTRMPQAKGKEVWVTEADIQGSVGGHPRSVTMRVTGDESQNGTAIGAVVGATLLGRGLAQTAGVHAPEVALPSKAFLNGLRRAGLQMTETVVDAEAVSP